MLFTGAGSTATFITPIVVAAGGGNFEANTTTTHTIPATISLGGLLGIGDPSNAGAVYSGTITISQSAAATPGLVTPYDQNGGDGTYSMTISGNIVDGAGSFKNPLILRSGGDGTWSITSTANTYAGGTVVEEGALRQHADRNGTASFPWRRAQAWGRAILRSIPGGRILLNAATNLAAGATTNLVSNSTDLAAIAVSYNGVPNLTANSSGMLALYGNRFRLYRRQRPGRARQRQDVHRRGNRSGAQRRPRSPVPAARCCRASTTSIAWAAWPAAKASSDPSLLNVSAVLTDRSVAANGDAAGPIVAAGRGRQPVERRLCIVTLSNTANSFSGPITVTGG